MCNKTWIMLATVGVGGGVTTLGGCVSVTTVNIGTKTSLERQLIGELEPLSDEEVLAASVRAQGQLGAGSPDELQAAAIAARRRQLFNRDDVDEQKKQGCLGETRDAHVAEHTYVSDAAATQRQSTLVTEENADRDAIIAWALATDTALTTTDRPQVVEVYRRLLAERVRPGEWLQGDDGAWVKR